MAKVMLGLGKDRHNSVRILLGSMKSPIERQRKKNERRGNYRGSCDGRRMII